MTRCLLLSFFIFLVCPLQTEAQYFPDTAWTRCYGGSGNEYGTYIQQTFDGGYIILGSSNSNDGDLVNAPAGPKTWVLKVDSLGNIEWQNYFNNFTYGAKNIRQTTDGGYILGGQKFTKLTPNGNIDWQVNITCDRVLQTYDGGYALTNTGRVYKLSPVASVEWYDEYFMLPIHGLEQRADSGLLIHGLRPGEGTPDGYWYATYDKHGNKEHPNLLGVASANGPLSGKPTSDRKYIFAGSGQSFTESWGQLIKIDSAGIWYRNIADLHPKDIIENIDHSFTFSGYKEYNDAFIGKVNSEGNGTLSRVYGGSNQESFDIIIPTKDTGYIALGTTWSNDGTVWGNHGAADLWIVKWKQDTSVHAPTPVLSVNHQTSKINEIKVYPTLSNGVVNVLLPQGCEQAKFEAYNIIGQAVEMKTTGSGNKRSIDISMQPAGQYTLRVMTGGEQKSFRITLNP